MRKHVFFTGDLLNDGFASKAKQFSDKFTKTSTQARYHSHKRSEGPRGGDETDLGLDTAVAKNERDALLREQQDVKEPSTKARPLQVHQMRTALECEQHHIQEQLNAQITISLSFLIFA